MTTTTVKQLFNKFDISDFHSVKWGTEFDEKRQGVYVVSTSNNPDKHLGITDQPIFDENQIKKWINKLPDFLIDGVKANPTSLKNRLASFWFPDESILYIGKAPTRKNESGIRKRVKEYFSTIIGNRCPHSGGQWIKVLKDLNSFIVYYGTCDNPGEIEREMLKFFMSNVSKETLSRLYDKELPIPFANIEFTVNKKHGLKNQRRKRTSENLESLVGKYIRGTRKMLPEKKAFENIKDFIEAHQGLVKHIAKNYMGRGISLSELIKAGNMGLKKFTGKNERKFKESIKMGKQYKMMGPSWWIRQAIMRNRQKETV